MLNKKTFIAGLFFHSYVLYTQETFFLHNHEYQKKKINDNIFFRPWNIFPWARKCLHIQVVNYNPLQNISAKIENSSKLNKTEKFWYLFIVIFERQYKKIVSAGETEH